MIAGGNANRYGQQAPILPRNHQNLKLGTTEDALEGCMVHLESNSMSPFLREKEACSHFAITLYSDLAEVHKQAIIPFIPRIMASIVRSLSFSNGGAPMHAACARVMGSVARYSINSSKPPHSNHEILCILCSPLLAVLCGKPEPASPGAAVCLQVLVESEYWRFAQADLQSILCDKVSCALVQTASPNEALLLLTKSLIKFSRSAALGHMCEWLRVALEFLQTDLGRCESKLQQHTAATQLITSILKIADVEDILKMADAERFCSDLHMATEAMEACTLDFVHELHTELVKALRAMRRLASGKSSISQDDSATGDVGSHQQSYHLRRANSCAQEGPGLLDQELRIAKPIMSDSLGISSSSVAKACIGLKNSPIYCLKQMKEKSMYDSFASVVSPKIKENAQAVIARQACSEASNHNCLYVLPKGIVSMCKTVDENTSTTLGSVKGSPDVDSQVRKDITGKQLTGKKCNDNNSHHQSDIECMCSIDLVRREGSVRSRNSADEMDRKSVSEIDGNTSVEHDKLFLDENEIEAAPIRTSHHHETLCKNDSNARPNRLADDVLCNGCTDLLLTPEWPATLTSMGRSSLTKVLRSQVLMENFGFTTPRRSLHSLQSAGKADMQDVKGCCMDACQIHTIATHFETSIDTPISSCCTTEHLDPSTGKESKQSLCHRREGFHWSLQGCDQFSLRLDDCEVQAHGGGQVSLEGCSDEKALLTTEKKGNVESEGAIQQRNWLQCEMEKYHIVKMRSEGCSGKIKKGQITTFPKVMLLGACIFTVGMPFLVSLSIYHPPNGLQVLVPT